jgi:hypothetical protein
MQIDATHYWVWVDPDRIGCTSKTIKTDNKKYSFRNVESDIKRAAGTTGKYNPECNRVWMLVTISDSENDENSSSQKLHVLSEKDTQIRRNAIKGCTMGSPSLCPYDESIAKKQIASCSHLSIGSPWIYVYPPSDKNLGDKSVLENTVLDKARKTSIKRKVAIRLNPYGGVSYAQPPLTDWSEGTWRFSISNDFSAQASQITQTNQRTGQDIGQVILESGETTSALHWEFDADVVSNLYSQCERRPYEAFVVERSTLKPFIRELSLQMGLNQLETSNLLTELNRKSMSFESKYVRIEFVPKEFLDKYLNLQINPTPHNVQRIFLAVSPQKQSLNTSKIPLPNIPKIKERSGEGENSFGIVEIGIIRSQ